MKFAFSAASCPQWDFQTLAANARRLGYDGVELSSLPNDSISTSSNLLLTDPAKVRRIFQDAGVKIPCITTSAAYSSDASSNSARATEIRRLIDLAADLGSPSIKIPDTQVKPGQNRALVAAEFADWLLPLADYASKSKSAAAEEEGGRVSNVGVLILVENALSFRCAREIWTVLDTASHPMIASCWNVFNAATIGEKPSVSVPTLNMRIQQAHIADAEFTPTGAVPCLLGVGDVPVENFLKRLRGVGFEGYVVCDCKPNAGDAAEAFLSDALMKMRMWDKRLAISDWEAAGALGMTSPA